MTKTELQKELDEWLDLFGRQLRSQDTRQLQFFTRLKEIVATLPEEELEKKDAQVQG